MAEIKYIKSRKDYVLRLTTDERTVLEIALTAVTLCHTWQKDIKDEILKAIRKGRIVI